MDNTKDITVLSLCTGYGGLELGLSLALTNPLRVVAVEVEAYALANLVAKAEAGKLAIETLWPDLRTFPAEKFRRCFDIITAGYPCQPFSHAGLRQGENDPRHLWPDIAGIIEAVRPVWCFFENVGGHLTLGFPEVYRSLRLMGYSVEAGLFSAAECGAPHRRERLFILAHSGRLRCDTRWAEQPLLRLRTDGDTQQMADTDRKRFQEQCRPKPILTAKPEPKYSNIFWPARPGQPQYEWEEPRTVVNARKQKPAGLSGDERQEISEVGDTSELGDTERRGCDRDARRRTGTVTADRHKQPEMADDNSGRGCGEQRHGKGLQGIGNNQKQVEPRLGRAVNGPSGRVDRLRLLGNGIVPQQAAKAFKYLLNKFKE